MAPPQLGRTWSLGVEVCRAAKNKYLLLAIVADRDNADGTVGLAVVVVVVVVGVVVLGVVAAVYFLEVDLEKKLL